MMEVRMDKYFDANRGLWNGWARINAGSEFYDVESFKAGKTSLQQIEIDELGDVTGKSLLHFQCHFGLDTMSWARRGARVTGADLSDEAISIARSLSEDLRIEAKFINSNIYDLPKVLEGEFDIVFTSYGALCWLPDLRRWAETIRHFLKAGGVFYIVEFHPYIGILDYEKGIIGESYFYNSEPLTYEEQGNYADPEADFRHRAYEWQHSLSDIVNAVVSAGLSIEFMHEFPYTTYGCFPFTEEAEPGKYMLKGRPNTMPFLFSLRATG
jgi:SAM-dependent methyltransferase